MSEAKNNMVYFNGRYMPVQQAGIGLFNGGWLHGAGLFETMWAQNRRVFRLDKHLDRLFSSAERLLAPVDRAALPDQDALGELMEQNGLAEARIRLTVRRTIRMVALTRRGMTSVSVGLEAQSAKIRPGGELKASPPGRP